MVHTATTVYPPDMATMTDDQAGRLRAAVMSMRAAEGELEARRDQRDALVRELAAEGVSDRVMAPTLGLHPTMVGNIRKGNRSSANRRSRGTSVAAGQLVLGEDVPETSTTAEG